jgi:hypothetical protein
MARRSRNRPDPKVKYQPVIVRKLASDDGIARAKRYHPDTGVSYLAHPVTGEPLPRVFAGAHFSDLDGHHVDPPEAISLPMSYPASHPDVVELKGRRVVHRPGGPASAPWNVTHTFIQADELVFHMVDGDHHFRVVQQPDKTDSDGNPSAEADCGDPTHQATWFYLAERV